MFKKWLGKNKGGKVFDYLDEDAIYTIPLPIKRRWYQFYKKRYEPTVFDYNEEYNPDLEFIGDSNNEGRRLSLRVSNILEFVRKYNGDYTRDELFSILASGEDKKKFREKFNRLVRDLSIGLDSKENVIYLRNSKEVESSVGREMFSENKKCRIMFDNYDREVCRSGPVCEKDLDKAVKMILKDPFCGVRLPRGKRMKFTVKNYPDNLPMFLKVSPRRTIKYFIFSKKNEKLFVVISGSIMRMTYDKTYGIDMMDESFP